MLRYTLTVILIFAIMDPLAPIKRTRPISECPICSAQEIFDEEEKVRLRETITRLEEIVKTQKVDWVVDATYTLIFGLWKELAAIKYWYGCRC